MDGGAISRVDMRFLYLTKLTCMYIYIYICFFVLLFFSFVCFWGRTTTAQFLDPYPFGWPVILTVAHHWAMLGLGFCAPPGKSRQVDALTGQTGELPALPEAAASHIELRCHPPLPCRGHRMRVHI